MRNMGTEMELIADNTTSMDPLLETTASPDQQDDSQDTTDRALASNTIMTNLVFPVVMNINEVLPNDKIKTDVQTSTSKHEDIQNLKRKETFLQKNIQKCASTLTEVIKTVSFIEEEFPELTKAIQDEDVNLVDLIMKKRFVNQTYVMIAAIKRDKVNLLKYLLHDIEDIASISDSGESLLHVAARMEAVSCCQYLLSKGVSPGVWDHKKENTPLHCIARSKSQNNKKLFDIFLNNGRDINVGLDMSSPLYAAIEANNLEMAQYILSHIEVIDKPDKDGITLLFFCTSSNVPSSVNCMEILISKGADVDKKSNGYTPLHKAAENRDVPKVKLLISRDADLSLKNKDGFSALHFINKNVPQCMTFFEDRLDSGINQDGSSSIKVDFQKIVRNIKESEKKSNSFFLEIANSPHQDLLKHPLMESFLHIKWNQYKYLHFVTSIFTHLIFSVVYTIWAIYTFTIVCPAKLSTEDANEAWNVFSVINCTSMKDNQQYRDYMLFDQMFSAFSIIVYISKQIVKFIINPWNRLKSFEFYLDCFIILSLLEPTQFLGPENGLYRSQYHAAACGVLAVWIEMMLNVGSLPGFGKYVQMFWAVLWSVINFGVVFISLIIGFGCSFYILFQKAPAFDIKDFPAAFVKIIVMMLGELEYDELYYNQNQYFNTSTQEQHNRTDIEQETEKQLFPVTAHIVLLAFIVLVSIVLMNLLVGLAVNDIQKLTEDGKQQYIVQQVEILYDLNLICFKCSKFAVNDLTVNLCGNIAPLNESLKTNLHAICLKRESETKKERKNNERLELLDLFRKLSGNAVENAKKCSRKRQVSSKRKTKFST